MTQKIINKFPKQDLLKNIEAYKNIIKIGKITKNLAEILRWRVQGYKLGENWSIEWIKEQISNGLKAPMVENEITPYWLLEEGGAIKNDVVDYVAPNGRISNLNEAQWKLVRTPEFKKWYGDWENNPKYSSKTLSRDGEPIVYYHGSPDNNITIFDRKKSKANQNVIGQFVYFSREKEYSSDEKFIGKAGKVYEVFLNIRNPLDLFSDVSEKDVNKFFDYTKAKNRPKSFKGWRGDWSSAFEEIQNENENPDFANAVSKFRFDAVYYHNGKGDEMFAIIDSNQIKLADGSNKTFNKNNPDIRFRLGGTIMEREAYANMNSIMQREFLAKMNPIRRREFLATQK